MAGNMYESIKTFEHAVSAFQAMNPTVIIGHDMKVPGDADFAREVSKNLRDRGIDAMAMCEFNEDVLLPGQDWELEMVKWAEHSSHLINIVSSSSRTENGEHRLVRGTALALDVNLDKKQTHVFELTRFGSDVTEMKKRANVKVMGSWDKDVARKDFIIEMMAMGPGGLGYEDSSENAAPEKKIDWSEAKFAHLLNCEVSVQMITPKMQKYMDEPGRYQAVIIVSEGKETSHNETIGGAIEFREEKQKEKTDKPVVVCTCPACGAKREAFFLDKAGEDSYGVAIIPNKPDDQCGVTVNIAPVPGYTLQKALDEIFA